MAARPTRLAAEDTQPLWDPSFEAYEPGVTERDRGCGEACWLLEANVGDMNRGFWRVIVENLRKMSCLLRDHLSSSSVSPLTLSDEKDKMLSDESVAFVGLFQNEFTVGGKADKRSCSKTRSRYAAK